LAEHPAPVDTQLLTESLETRWRRAAWDTARHPGV